MHARHVALSLSFVLLSPPSHAKAQKQTSAADGRIVTAAAAGPTPATQEDEQLATGAPSVDTAWSMLTTAATTAKRPQTRVQALAALGTMGSNPHAVRLIRDAMKDPDVDVRTAAILAASATHDRRLLPDIRELLKDSEPQVVFAAATTLWKLHDRSGEDVLMAVADGERRATPTLMHGAGQDMNRDLHDPAALTRIGVTEGASMLLGPFGFGIKAIEYMRKSGGAAARATAIDLISEQRTPEVRSELLDALTDRDPAVRAAAAKALGQRHEASLAKPLGTLFADSKLPVRLTAAAAYINCAGRSHPRSTQH